MICTYEVNENNYSFKLSGDLDSEYWKSLMLQLTKSLKPQIGEVLHFTVDCTNLNPINNPETNET